MIGKFRRLLSGINRTPAMLLAERIDAYRRSEDKPALRAQIGAMLANLDDDERHAMMLSNSKNGQEETLLCKLFRAGLDDEAGTLLGNGFDMRRFPDHRFVLAAITAFRQQPDKLEPLLKTLIQHGANINETDALGNGAFQALFEQRVNQAELLPILVRQGFDLYQTDEYGRSLVKRMQLALGNLFRARDGVNDVQKSDIYRFFFSHGVMRIDGSLVADLWQLQDHQGDAISIRRRDGVVPQLESKGLAAFIAETKKTHGHALSKQLACPSADPDYVTRLSHETLVALYAIGRSEVFNPELWHQHPDLFMQHYQNMPEHIQAEMRTIAAPLFVPICERAAAHQPVVSWGERITQPDAMPEKHYAR